MKAEASWWIKDFPNHPVTSRGNVGLQSIMKQSGTRGDGNSRGGREKGREEEEEEEVEVLLLLLFVLLFDDDNDESSMFEAISVILESMLDNNNIDDTYRI